MVTEFVTLVGPGYSGTGEYTSLTNWEANVQCDLTANNTKVFPGTMTGVIPDNVTVTGDTSGASGTCVHATTTQILIKSIGTTQFESGGEVIRYSTTQYFTSSSGGDSAAAVADCRSTGAADTSNTNIDGWTSDTTNYIKVWTNTSATGGDGPDGTFRHDGTMPGGTDKIYRRSNTSGYNFQPYEDGVICEGIAFTTSSTGEVTKCWGDDPRFGYNLFEDTANSAAAIYFRNSASASDRYAFNNIVWGFWKGIYNYAQTGTTYCYLYNNTIDACATSIEATIANTVCKNNILSNATTAEFGGSGVASTSTHNVVESASAGCVGATWSTGTTTSASSNKLVDSGATFVTDGVQVGSCVKNTTDTTYTYVTAVDSETQLSVNDDIFASSEGYEVYTNMRGIVTYENEGSNDYHLDSTDTVAIDKGKDLSSDSDLSFSDDIDGDTRTGTWDVGADQYVSVEKTCSGTATFSSFSASGTGQAKRNASGTATFSSFSASGTGQAKRNASGTATFSAFSASGTATREVKPSGTATFSTFSASGTAQAKRNASGTATFSSFSASGTATREVKPSGTATFSAFSASGTAQAKRNASGTATFSAFSASGSAEKGYTCSGTATFSAFSASGTATREVKPSGTATFSAFSASGTAQAKRNASGTATYSAFSASGTAEKGKECSGTATYSVFSASGTCIRAALASGTAIYIGSITAVGTGIAARNASGTATFSAFSAAGSGISGAELLAEPKHIFDLPEINTVFDLSEVQTVFDLQQRT